MRLRSTYILSFLVLALSSCSHRNSDEPTLPKSPVIMMDCGNAGIDIWQAVTVGRAATLPAPELDIIQSVGIFAINDASPDLVFDNQQFYGRESRLLASNPSLSYLSSSWPLGNDWPYNPVQTWVAGANYVFVGYSPYYPTGVKAVEGDHSDFAELEWKGLSSISASDHLISTCACCQAKSKDNETVSLNLQHLMARLRFCFQLGDHYADLRKVVVKEMKVNYSESRRMTLTVSFAKEGSIYKSTYRWQREDPGTGVTSVPLRNEQGVDSIILDKGSDFQPLASLYYEPGDPLNMFDIEVIYDVYDQAGALLRANDRAVSAITMLRTVEAGKYYDVRIRIEPSYLYVLSDQEPDSDGALIIL